MEPADREYVHFAWQRGEVRVVVATVAFGMGAATNTPVFRNEITYNKFPPFLLGVNKPDVRFVIHFSLSKSLSSFYQACWFFPHCTYGIAILNRIY
jgi:hypothetical protein